MPKREFLQLAHTYDPKKHGVGGWWYSIKLDGLRAFWDGGVSTGIPKSDVPWANIAKDARYKDRQIATGLWTRYGNVIHAPEWWLKDLPKIMLDGELWGSSLHRQDIASIVKSHKPGTGWNKIQLYAYDIPPLEMIFDDGAITNIHFKKVIKMDEIERFIKSRNYFNEWEYVHYSRNPFRSAYNFLISRYDNSLSWQPHVQYQLPFQTSLAENHLGSIKLNFNQDGIIIRHPDKCWMPERVWHVLKMKPEEDDEAIVIGAITGKEGKLLGMLGALIVEWNGKTFELSGFTDSERVLSSSYGSDIAKDWAIENPGINCIKGVYAKFFPIGTEVTFKYRGLSKDGIPQEARYWRKA